MQNLGVNITLEGNNINTHVISYTRDVDICSGVGTLLMVVDKNTTVSIGDAVRIFEGGTKVGTFYIGTTSESVKDGTISLNCQDMSKYLQSYFIATMHNVGGGSSKYWIEQVLTWAKVSYNFTTASNGYALPPNTKIGLEFGYNVVLTLCQQSGWYFYFDGEGVCQIGELSTSWSNPQFTLAESGGLILSEQLVSDDSQLRNRVVVWGGSVPGGTTPYEVYTELNVTTPWDRDANDKRTIVYSNNYIRNTGTAWALGKKLLDEYSRTVSLKTYEIAGAFGETIGTIGYFDTYIYNGTGIVTSLSASVSSKGFVTTIFVDERCPRQFGYWSLGAEYVYVGTNGNGIWRKSLDSSTWSDWSTGLTNLYIKDLKIKSGLFACTSNDYRVYYRKIIDSSWTVFSPTGFFDGDLVEYELDTLYSAGCGIDETIGKIIYGFTDKTNKKSWIVTRYPSGEYSITFVTAENGEDRYILKDVDTNTVHTVATALTIVDVLDPTTTAFEDAEGLPQSVFQPITETYSIDPRLVSLGPKDTGNVTVTSELTLSQSLAVHYIPDGIMYALTKSGLYIKNLDTGSLSSYAHGGTFTTAKTYIYPETDDFIHIINGVTHWTFVPSTLTLTNISYSAVGSNNMMVGKIVFHAYGSSIVGDGTAHLIAYDVTTQTNVDVQTSTLFVEATPYTTTSTSVPFVCGGKVYAGSVGISYTDNGSDVDISIVKAKMYMNLDGSSGGYTTESIIAENFVGYNLSASGGASYLTRNKGNDAYVYEAGGYSYAPIPYLGVTNIRAEARVANWYTGGSSEISSQTFDSSQATGLTTWEFAHCDGAGGISFGGGGGTSFIGRTSALVVISHSTDLVATSKHAYDLKGGTNFSVNSWFGSYTRYSKTINEYDGTILAQNGSLAIKSLDFGGNEIATLVGASYNHDTYVHLPEHIIEFDLGATSRIYSYANPVTLGDLPGPTTSGVGGVVLRANPIVASGDTFGAVKFTTYPLEIEVSRESPFVFFGGIVTTSGNPGGTGEMWLSAYVASGSFVSVGDFIGLPLDTMGYYPDARVGDVLGLSSTSTSGWTYAQNPNSFARYIYSLRPYRSIQHKSGLYFREAYDYFDSWKYFEGFPGTLHKCELSNYKFSSPYTFVSSSGYPSYFWQLNPGYDSSFVEYSTGLPNGNITVIRLDDRI